MAYEEAYAYEYAEEDLITCDYCGNRWDGCAQCNCWGYLNSAQENAETSEAASSEASSEAETSETAASETASEAATN
jgi:predicted ATP-dependent serine protease